MGKNFAVAFAAMRPFAGFIGPVFAGGETTQQRSDPKSLGIDLDNSAVYYNGEIPATFASAGQSQSTIRILAMSNISACAGVAAAFTFERGQ